MEEVLDVEINAIGFFPRSAVLTPVVTFDMPLCSLGLSFSIYNLHENLSKCSPAPKC